VTIEHRRTFACFGGECSVLIGDAKRPADAAAAAAMVQRTLLECHRRFSRFDPESELSALNRDPRVEVGVSPLLRRLVEAALQGARITGGLVDATLGHEIERSGYASHMEGPGLALARALALAPRRAPARPDPAGRWSQITVDRRRGTITRPPGLTLDLGGIAKGVFADELAAQLAGFDSFAIDCAGDLRIGGAARTARRVHVASPFDDAVAHTFALSSASVATSGIGRRSWLTADGRPAHHLLDPASGTPAFTGVVQATALAATAAEAESLAKAAVLSGSAGATSWLTHGGAIVYEDGSCVVCEPGTGDLATRPEIQARRSASTCSRSGSLTIS
jgi:thiamine biosynthesis lipoprotein